jgi:signal transduction histidine kinase
MILFKAHRGEIKVESKESEGTEFTVILPNNKTSANRPAGIET